MRGADTDENRRSAGRETSDPRGVHEPEPRARVPGGSGGADEALGRRPPFMSFVSHELKTPVHAIGLLAELVSAGDDPEEMRRIAERILCATRRLNVLMSDLAELARLHDDEWREPAKRFVAVDDALTRAMQRVEHLAEVNRVALHLSGEHGIHIDGNLGMLSIAITNLLVNSIQHSPRRSTITISRNMRRGGASIAIRDEGPGIPPETRRDMVRSSTAGDRPPFENPPATGLGLSIVRSVAGYHGGDVEVLSSPGRGTVFEFRIPPPRRVRDTFRLCAASADAGFVPAPVDRKRFSGE